MLELRRQLAILGHGGPLVVEDAGIGGSFVDHWLDGEDDADLETATRVRHAEVQKLGLFVKSPADSVPAVLTHDREAGGLDVTLNGMAEVTQTLVGARELEADLHGLSRRIEQTLCHGTDVADTDTHIHVTVVSILENGDVHGEDIALDELAGTRNAVHDLIVY